MKIGKGSPERMLFDDQLRALVSASAREMGIDGRRVLTIIPDGTRTMPMAQLFPLLQGEIGQRAAACDYLVALGTHPLMSDEQLTRMLGRPVINGICDGSRIYNHHWDIADTLADVGTIPASDVEEVSGFSGGNKYLFPGISGKEMIDQTHWLGALLGSYHVIGTESTPVRDLIDRAAAKIKVPVACMALVVTKEGVSGFYFG